MSGCFFIVAAPSGAGKSSLVNALLAADPDLALSISYTSRPPRPGETDGQHYHFVGRADFERMAAESAFFEHALVHGDWKGTAKDTVSKLLAAGRDVLLEIDYQGARQVRAKHPGCLGIFILPPSRAELERRLRSRAQDSEETIGRRLADSRQEIAHACEFDYIVVNEDFETAVADTCAVFRASRLRRDIQARRHAALIDRLLSGA